MNDTTQADRQRATVNAILESRARVGDAASAMQDAMAHAARTLIRAASLDTEYRGAVAEPEPEPEPEPTHPCGSVKVADCGCEDCISVQVCRYVDDATAQAYRDRCDAQDAKAKLAKAERKAEPAVIATPEQLATVQLIRGSVSVQDAVGYLMDDASAKAYKDGRQAERIRKAERKAAKRKAKAKRERVRPTAIAHASPDMQTHASTFESVRDDAPAQERAPLAVLATPAPKPYTGADSTEHVYTKILRAMASDELGPSVNARVNWQASTVRGGILRVSIDLAHIESVNAYVGQSDKVWGQALATTIRPNQSKTAKRRRVTYAPLTDALDWAFYLVTPTNKSRADAWPMPASPHLRKGASVHDLRLPIDACDNWRLSVKGSMLRIDFALPTYANVVPVNRSPSWGHCIATTRHPGARRITKTITLGPCLVLLLDVIQRVKGRAA